MKSALYAGAAAAALAALAAPAFAQSRDQIRIVGSSTVFPFTTAVAEQFGQQTGKFKTPVVEITGTGGGIKLFCGGVGDDTPTSPTPRARIKKSEFEACADNGVDRHHRDQDRLRRHRARPLERAARDARPDARADLPGAREARSPVDGKLVANPYKNWNEIDPSLPDEKIEVLGPPPTSGTRDAFVELVMDARLRRVPGDRGADEADTPRRSASAIREDGA